MNGIYSLGRGMERIDVPESHEKNNLPIGTILQLIGYDNPRYCIIKNLGVSPDFPYCGATYETINIETGDIGRHNMLSVDHISQKSVILGIHMFYTDEIMSPDEIMDLIKLSKQKKINDIKAKQLEDQRKAEELDYLIKHYSYLEKQSETKKSSYALGASNIRKELKLKWPDIKFSVRSEGYSMGCSIDIKWTAGPTVEEVRAITNKYEYGTFDSMTDCAGEISSQFVDLFGGARFVFEQHNLGKRKTIVFRWQSV